MLLVMLGNSNSVLLVLPLLSQHERPWACGILFNRKKPLLRSHCEDASLTKPDLQQA